MTKSISIIRDESFKIRTSEIPKDLTQSLVKKFTYSFYKESACERCEWRPDRHSENCDNCVAFLGRKATAKIVGGADNPYETQVVSVPRGARQKLAKILKSKGYTHFEFEKHLPKETKLSSPIKLIKEPRDYQVDARDAFIAAKHGVISAPPRSGKTVMGAMVVSELGLKTLILASQRDWLLNFKETFIGSPTQEKFTNAKARQVGFAKSLKDFEMYDICLCTFQQFMSESGRKLLEKIKDLFPIVIIDEVHGVPAIQTARVLSRFNSRYTLGLSGTPDRKSGDYVIAEDLVGPVVYEAKVDRLRPAVEVLRTPGEYKTKMMGNAGFTYLVSKLENNTPRRNAIVREAIKRSKQGHLVLIPMTRVESILKYTRDINEEMGPKYALPFYGGITKEQRTSFIEAARQYKCKIVVGNIALLATGLNIPRASCLIDIGINSNLPKATQRFSRILTPFEGKPNPLIIFPLDDCDIMRKTRRNEFWNALMAFNPIVNKETQSELNAYFSSSKKNRYDDYHEITRGGL